MGQHLARINAAALDESRQFLRAQTAAGHEAAANLLVGHARAPFDARDFHIFPGAEIIYVADDAARLQHADGLGKGVHIAPGDDHPIHTLASGLVQDLLVDGAVAIVDDLCGAVFFGQIGADFAGADSEEIGCTPERCGGHCHQPYRADAHYAHVVTILYVGQLRSVKARGHHIAEHDRRAGIDAFGEQRQIAVGVIDVEILGEYPVFEVGKFPTGQHPARVHGEAALGFQRIPVRGDGGHDDLVAGFKIFDQSSHFIHDAHGFVT